mmetsp:Transcript_14139/g.59813  ORF Transcript_14139/g.59813 Transcript_14139/m.59813 type:complete len:230 (+) Transcript_14139:2732-3421(+)
MAPYLSHMSADSSRRTAVRASDGTDAGAAGTGSTERYGESASTPSRGAPFAGAGAATAGAGAESLSLVDPRVLLAGAPFAASSVSPRFARACSSRRIASVAVSRTTRQPSTQASLSASTHSSVAMAPNASAHSCLTISSSVASLSTRLRTPTAPGACICPSAKATSWRNSAEGSSVMAPSSAATASSPPMLRRVKSARNLRGMDSDWSTSSARCVSTLMVRRRRGSRSE